MKHFNKSIDWRLFKILLFGCTITSLMVMPYAFSLSPGLKDLISPALIIAQIIQAIILFSIVIYFGLVLSNKVGFGLPVLQAYINNKNYKNILKAIIKESVMFGILAAALIIVLSFVTKATSVSLLSSEIAVLGWQRFFASFYGGVSEEVLMRLFTMNLFVWIIYKFKRTKEGKPTNFGIWVAIIVSSIIFGLGHLPITAGLVAITPVVIFRAILLNGVGGIIFGWLYKKNGLESAMISHFTADIGIHVIFPIIAAIFI
jgi:membrane protease YdiL (CAAX protease family)